MYLKKGQIRWSEFALLPFYFYLFELRNHCVFELQNLKFRRGIIKMSPLIYIYLLQKSPVAGLGHVS